MEPIKWELTMFSRKRPILNLQMLSGPFLFQLLHKYKYKKRKHKNTKKSHIETALAIRPISLPASAPECDLCSHSFSLHKGCLSKLLSMCFEKCRIKQTLKRPIYELGGMFMLAVSLALEIDHVKTFVCRPAFFALSLTFRE